MKTIAITGASGFVGQHLTKVFAEQGYVVVPILRTDIHDRNKLQI